MTRNVKVFLSLFLVFAMLSVLATAVVAEPTGETVPVTVNAKDQDKFFVYFNGANAPALSYDAPVGVPLDLRVEPAEGYEVVSVNVIDLNSYEGVAVTPRENMVYTIEDVVSGCAYSIMVKVNAVPVDVPSDDPSDTPSDTPSNVPSDDPTEDPSDTPSDVPSDDPTEDPSDTPSDIPSDDPTEDPSDTPSDVPSDDPSGDTSSDVPPANTAELKLTIKGAGSVVVGGETVTSEGGTMEKTFWLEINVATDIVFTPAYGYRMVSLKLDGQNRSLKDSMTLTINEYTTLEVEFGPDTVTPETYQILISCSNNGGYVVAGGYEIVGNSSKTLTVSAGESLTIVVHPSEGFQVDSFKVGSTAQNLTDGTFVLENIVSNATISISFKAVVTQINPLEAADIDWTPVEGKIIIDLTANPYVGKSVFDKINTLTAADAQSVVIKTSSVQWIVPCGGTIGGVEDAYVKLSVSVGPNGSNYETLKVYLLNYYPNAVFQYYELAENITLPAGTKVSFNLSGYASATGGDKVTLWAKVKEDGKDRLKVIGDTGTTLTSGWTTPMEYANSTNMFAIVDKVTSFKVDVTVTIGGTVTPSEDLTMVQGEDKPFHVQANMGYVISALYVNGVLQKGAEGKDVFTYELKDISADTSIRAEFMLKEDYEEHKKNQENSQQEGKPGDVDSDDRSGTGLIVAIIIIVVAIAGAATLFIVKWRQEKF